MSRFPKVDLSGIRLIPIDERPSKVSESQWAAPFEPGVEFDRFVASLPHLLKATELRELADHVVGALDAGRPRIMMFGAHVVKAGLVPVVVDLLERGILSGVAMNSAAAIHDVEGALFARTSEDVAAAITDGSFGMARETGEFINGVLTRAWRSDDHDIGYGEALGDALAARSSNRPSILATCSRLGLPATVHAAIGTDIIHQQPSMDGAATGELTFRDFRLLCHELLDLGGGGVVLNVGSAVLLPEVFLKALTVARNLGAKAFDFTTANFDMIQHYRPNTNVVERPTRDGGQGYTFTGHHEIMIPLLAAMVKSRMAGSR